MAETLLFVNLVLLAILQLFLILYYFRAVVSKFGAITKIFRSAGDVKIPVIGLSLINLTEEQFTSFRSIAVSSDQEVDCRRFYFEGTSLRSLTYCAYSGTVYACRVVLSLPENFSQSDLYYWFRERFLVDEKSRFFARENPELKAIEVFGWKGSFMIRGGELVMDFVNEKLKKELKLRKIDDMFRALDERVRKPHTEVVRKSYES